MTLSGERERGGTKDMLYDTCTVTTYPGLEDDLEMLPARVVYHVLTDVH